MQLTPIDEQILINTPFEQMAGSSVAITGHGFIAKSIIEAIKFWNSKFNARIYYDVYSKSNGCDLVKYEIPSHIDYEYIIHTACPVRVSPKDYNYFHNVTYYGTKHAFINHPKAKHLHISSGAVTRLKEIDIASASNDSEIYAIGKKDSETAAQMYSQNAKIARVYSVYGPHMDLNNGLALSNFIKAKIENTQVSLDNHGRRSFMHSTDLVNWLITILIKGEDKKIYDVGSFLPLTFRDVLDILGIKNVISFYGEDKPSYLPTNTAAIDELGLVEYINPHYGIRDTLRQKINSSK